MLLRPDKWVMELVKEEFKHLLYQDLKVWILAVQKYDVWVMECRFAVFQEKVIYDQINFMLIIFLLYACFIHDHECHSHIRDALSSSGECELTLRAFHKCDAQKRRDIAEKYSSSFHSVLGADVARLSWKAGFIVDTLLADGSLCHAAKYLAYCLQDGVWKHNMAVVEILVGHSANELAEIEKEYVAATGRTIVGDLQAEYDDELVRDILIERLALKVLGVLNLLISFVDIIIPTFFSFAYPFPDVAALTDLAHISRS